MPNENAQVVDQGTDDGNEGTPQIPETPETTDWKAKYEETQNKVEEMAGRLKRAETKLSKTETKPDKAPSKSSELDYGQKAFLIANGVKGNEEVGLVKQIMENTGKTLDEVLESKYFQAELKDLRDAKAVAEAIPNGTKRSGQSARDTVDYWIAKGELPPADQRELRQQVVNARMKAETNKNIFTDNPVVR